MLKSATLPYIALSIADDRLLSFDALQDESRERSALRQEAARLSVAYGDNAYSKFLSEHGRRPDTAQAAVIGRLLGTRVRAADGTMQPVLSFDERESRRRSLKAHDESRALNRDIRRLKRAVADIADLASSSSVSVCISAAGESAVLRSQIDSVLDWLRRFAEAADCCDERVSRR